MAAGGEADPGHSAPARPKLKSHLQPFLALTLGEPFLTSEPFPNLELGSGEDVCTAMLRTKCSCGTWHCGGCCWCPADARAWDCPTKTGPCPSLDPFLKERAQEGAGLCVTDGRTQSSSPSGSHKPFREQPCVLQAAQRLEVPDFLCSQPSGRSGPVTHSPENSLVLTQKQLSRTLCPA